MKIELEVCPDGSLRHNRVFESDVIRIGRSRRCELTIARDMISSEHAVIEARNGRLFIRDVGSTNGTFLNSQRLTQVSRLQIGDVVVFGNAGPSIRITAITDRKPAGEDSRRSPFEFPGGALLSQPPNARLPSLAPKQSGVAPVGSSLLLASRLVGPDHLGKLNGTEPSTRTIVRAMEEKQKLFWGFAIGAVIGVCLIGGFLSLVLFLAIPDDTAWVSRIDKQYRGSVFFVTIVDPRSGMNLGGGTAFAIDSNGTFATNGHIAIPMAEMLENGVAPILISHGGETTYKVVEAKCHPSYSASDADSNNIFANDVGILKADISGSKRPQAVRLASTAEFQKLQAGDQICYIGFPHFLGNDFADRTSIVARTHAGNINRVTDFQKRDSQDSKNTRLLEHDLKVYKGASGSPIFDSRGAVVGIVNGLSVFQDEQSGMTEVTGGAKYGIRIDALLDMID